MGTQMQLQAQAKATKTYMIKEKTCNVQVCIPYTVGSQKKFKRTLLFWHRVRGMRGVAKDKLLPLL